ncbi:S1C family serine protease [Nonomuraea sp. LPB2021202275-12-8]|uniref:S1C family serine protease n=1 Tax=Nonomuraea sp. LPB2021202275-12-8 TaxID=3120159 RepID=UPI00300DB770
MGKVAGGLAAVVLLLLTACGPASAPIAPPRTTQVSPLATSAPATSPPSGAMPGPPLEVVYERVIAEVLPSIVQITTKVGLGSGIIYDAEGHIVTNAHVVGEATELNVTLATGGTPRKARLVKTFAPGDLAVIKVDNAQGLQPARWGDSAKLRVGQMVLAMGNPLGLSGSVTQGIVSALGRTVSEPESAGSPGATIAGAIQTSAAINPGNSGGALVDLSGQVIGIPTLAATDPSLGGGAAPGIGFAIPSNTALDIASQIIKYGKVVNSHRAALGVRGNTIINADGESTGVGVGVVDPGSAAARAGIRAGDVIIGIDGKATSAMAQLTEALTTYRPGDKVSLKVVRPSGRTEQVTVILGELPGE